jgi:PAS domain-containing protein
LPETALTQLLTAWRDAERRWTETAASEHGENGTTEAVLHAFLAYQAATGRPGEMLLITDTDGTYRAVDARVTPILGYRPEELVGRRVRDITAPSSDGGALLWSLFLERGMMEGQYDLLRADETVVSMRFSARAHHPIPGYHTSKLSLLP